MKYWRGYLVAAILAACTWGFREIASTHTKLVDMIYPYVTRMVQNYLTGWSGAVDFCVWQAVLLALLAAAFASIVLMIIFKWNPIQWFGWITAVVSLIVLLHTGVFGMNEFAGPIAEDIRLTEVEGTTQEMTAAAEYYRDQANALAGEVARNSDGTVKLPELKTLNEQAVSGFEHLVYDQYYSVFAGSTQPVKELGMADYYTQQGRMGLTVAITGEAAVNMQAPSVMIPFAISREMCYRMCIANPQDTAFAAFMACQANDTPEFRYAAYVMAYQYCLNALPDAAASGVAAHAGTQLRNDVEIWEEFIARGITEKDAQENAQIYEDVAILLASWHHQKVVLPSIMEPEVEFDPMDETQVDMTGLPHVTTPTEAAA